MTTFLSIPTVTRTTPVPDPATAVAGIPAPVMPRGLSRVETVLRRDGFGDSVITGLTQKTAADRRAVADARKTYGAVRATVGYSGSAAMLTSGAAQSKLGKNTLFSLGLMLTPERGMMSPLLADVRDAFGMSGAWIVAGSARVPVAVGAWSARGRPVPTRTRFSDCSCLALLFAHHG